MTCEHTTVLAIRCLRSQRGVPLPVAFGPEEPARLEWCVDCGAMKVVHIDARGGVSRRLERWVLPRSDEAKWAAVVHREPCDVLLEPSHLAERIARSVTVFKMWCVRCSDPELQPEGSRVNPASVSRQSTGLTAIEMHAFAEAHVGHGKLGLRVLGSEDEPPTNVEGVPLAEGLQQHASIQEAHDVMRAIAASRVPKPDGRR